MRGLGFDVETTGLDSEVDRITEIGAVIWDTKKRAPLFLHNSNHKWDDMPPLSDFITELTGITQDHLDEFCCDNFATMTDLCNLMLKVDFVLVGMEMTDILWIDTAVDIPFPKNIKTRGLIHLCADHKINPNDFAHRGLFDILKTAQLLDYYDIDVVIKRAKTPNVTVRAMCLAPFKDPKPDGEKETDIAKKNGFRWNGKAKVWIRVCKEDEVKELEEMLPFRLEKWSEDVSSKT